MKYPDVRLLLFVPAPGVMDRINQPLVSVLGEEGEQDLQRQLLQHQIDLLTEAAFCPLQLWLTADVARRAPPFPGECHVQQGDDPGARLSKAIASAAPGKRAVLLIGSACPGLDAAYLEQALASLRDGADLVLGPARGGGCALLGLTRPQPTLFDGLDEKGEGMLAQLRARADEAGLRQRLLPELEVIERPEDLALLADHGIFPRISRRLLAGGDRH